MLCSDNDDDGNDDYSGPVVTIVAVAVTPDRAIVLSDGAQRVELRVFMQDEIKIKISARLACVCSQLAIRKMAATCLPTAQRVGNKTAVDAGSAGGQTAAD